MIGDDFHPSDAAGANGPGELAPLDAETRRDREAAIARHLGCATGVLHLGAHTGQERDEYARRDLPVVWVEAHPIICRRLSDNIAPFSEQQALCGLLAAVDGREVGFGRSSTMNGESSSMYEFGASAHALWPDQELEMIERLRLPTVTLDQLLSDHGIAAADHDFWVVDLQGAELAALQGAARSLGACRALVVEVSTVEVYRGGAMWPDVRDELKRQGFSAAWSPARPHDDVLFVRD